MLALLGVARSDASEPVPMDRAVLLSTLVGQASLAQERLRLDGEMRELSLLKERDRLRAALLSSIGHDLRTPLAAASSAIDALAAAYPQAPAIPAARSQMQRLRRFLDNLVDMVRLDSDAVHLSLEPVDLTDAVSGAIDAVRDLLHDARIDLHLAPDLPLVRADPTLLHHILINLLNNAAQHGADQGRITITASKTGQNVTLAIQDDGPGLPVTDRDLFGIFARGEGSDRTGLGLAIVKGFDDAIHVHVAAANASAGGAVFSLAFPTW